MAKLTMKKVQKKHTIVELWELFLLDKRAIGVKEKTIQSYNNCFRALQNFYNFDINVDDFDNQEVNKLVSLLRSGNRLDGTNKPLSNSSIKSYMITVKSFFSWCQKNGYSELNVKIYNCEETAKDVYTNDEIKRLVQKPNMNKCTFCDYRNWVIVCFLLNSGCRAGTLRNILIKDLDFDSSMILCRHTKNGSVIYIPMSQSLIKILKEYLSIREGKSDDYLFPTENNEQLTENGLRLAIAHYNKSREVEKTSIHLFRHYFAKTYLQNGGDVFRLQKILGHKDIKMTVHYSNLYGEDVKRGFEEFNPLSIQLSQNKLKIKR